MGHGARPALNLTASVSPAARMRGGAHPSEGGVVKTTLSVLGNAALVVVFLCAAAVAFAAFCGLIMLFVAGGAG